MRAFYFQFSALAGVLVFLGRLWKYAPLEQTIISGIATGLLVYLVLVAGHAAVQRILAFTPPPAEEKAGRDAEPRAGERAADADEKHRSGSLQQAAA